MEYVEVLVNERPYRASNFCYKHGEKWAYIEGYYGPLVEWKKVGCKEKIATVLALAWQEPINFGQESDGQLTMF